LSPADPPDDQPPDETSDSSKDETPDSSKNETSGSPSKDSAEKWVLTKDALDKLLEHFSEDPDEAVRRYELMRVKLTRYFEWNSCSAPEHEVDTCVDRVARRIEEGTEIVNLRAYFFTVAHLVFLESLKRRGLAGPALDDIPEVADDPPTLDEQKEGRLSCLDECLDQLPTANRELILEYYEHDGREKIERRKKMAAERGIPLNALRIRAHRIRNGLEKCVRKCLGSRNETD
jgi:DNA-directed RNA polymerase specialized sigma24 family protein